MSPLHRRIVVVFVAACAVCAAVLSFWAGVQSHTQTAVEVPQHPATP